MVTGIYNADGTDGELVHGLGAVRENVVWLGGMKMVNEGQGNGAVLPGHLLIAGTVDGDVEHATDGSHRVLGIALENDLKADDGTVLDAYADNAWVPYSKLAGGLFMLKVKNAETLVEGDKLVAAAAGEVRKYVAQTDTVAGDAGGAIIGTYLGKADVTAGADTRVAVKVVSA